MLKADSVPHPRGLGPDLEFSQIETALQTEQASGKRSET